MFSTTCLLAEDPSESNYAQMDRTMVGTKWQQDSINQGFRKQRELRGLSISTPLRENVLKSKNAKHHVQRRSSLVSSPSVCLQRVKWIHSTPVSRLPSSFPKLAYRGQHLYGNRSDRLMHAIRGFMRLVYAVGLGSLAMAICIVERLRTQ